MRKVTARIMVLLLAVSLVLCGCKDDTTPADDSTLEASVHYGGKIVVGITQDLDSLDPHKAVAAGTKEVLCNIFEGLIKVDPDGNFVPAVASEYEISPDGCRYEFTLREGVKFHNQKTVTAEDVIYSLKRAAGMLETNEPDVTPIAAFSIISAINKTEKGVEVVLSEPNTELIGFFTSSIIPCDYDGQAGAPVGTGPFKFVSYEPLQKFVVEKNEDYYIKGVPYLDGVTFKICASIDSAFLELMAQSIDVFPYLTNDQALQLEGTYQILDGTSNLVQALFLNNKVKPFDDIRVRQAVCHAIDRQAVLNVVAGGKGSIIGTNMFPTFAKYFDASLTDTYPHDPQMSKQLLKDAGYPEGFEFTISVPSNYDFHVRTAQVIAEQLKNVGINAKIKLVEWSTWLSDIYQGRDFEGTVIGLDSKLAPSDIFRFYPTTSPKNFINYSNEEFDEIFAKAQLATDENEKASLYKKLEAVITADAASAYIQSPAQFVALSKKLDGYKFYPVVVQDMSTVYYKTEPVK